MKIEPEHGLAVQFIALEIGMNSPDQGADPAARSCWRSPAVCRKAAIRCPMMPNSPTCRRTTASGV